MRFVTFLQRFVAVAIFVLVTAATTLSQSDRGSIAGTVLDSSGGVVTTPTSLQPTLQPAPHIPRPLAQQAATGSTTYVSASTV